MKVPRHKYDYRATPGSAGTKIASMVGPGKRVLELGPGPGSITSLLHNQGCKVTALEVDQSAIDIVSEYCEQIVVCNLNDPAWPQMLEGVGRFDAIVAGDVLEHLYDPWDTLQKLPSLLESGGCIVISLPNLGHCGVISSLLEGDFDYRPWGLLDRTHLRFFSVGSIQKLIEKCGLKIIDADFVVKHPEQTEFAKGWRALTDEARQVLTTATYGMVYQVVVKAVPLYAPGRASKLVEFAVPQPASLRFNLRLKSYLLSFLSLDARYKLSEAFRKFLSWR